MNGRTPPSPHPSVRGGQPPISATPGHELARLRLVGVAPDTPMVGVRWRALPVFQVPQATPAPAPGQVRSRIPESGGPGSPPGEIDGVRVPRGRLRVTHAQSSKGGKGSFFPRAVQGRCRWPCSRIPVWVITAVYPHRWQVRSFLRWRDGLGDQLTDRHPRIGRALLRPSRPKPLGRERGYRRS